MELLSKGNSARVGPVLKGRGNAPVMTPLSGVPAFSRSGKLLPFTKLQSSRRFMNAWSSPTSVAVSAKGVSWRRGASMSGNPPTCFVRGTVTSRNTCSAAIRHFVTKTILSVRMYGNAYVYCIFDKSQPWTWIAAVISFENLLFELWIFSHRLATKQKVN